MLTVTYTMNSFQRAKPYMQCIGNVMEQLLKRMETGQLYTIPEIGSCCMTMHHHITLQW